MSVKLNTWSTVYAAARKGTVQQDYFAARDMFNGQEHDEPVQVGDKAYFVDSIANDDGTYRRYRVNRISANGVVEHAPFDPLARVPDMLTLEEALRSRDSYVYHAAVRERGRVTGHKLAE